MAKVAWKKYDYTAQLGPGNNIAYRPLVEIRVSTASNVKPLSVMAMIDSGTDSTVFNAEIAYALGIDPKKCQKVKVGGIGSAEGFICTITMSIPDFNTAMQIPVIFVENPPFDGLLGQKHFFERFKIRFEKDKNSFFLALVQT
jgi:hypothetical protein